MQSYAKRLTGKQVLDIMFALPSDTENSDTEQDDGAYEELNELSYNDTTDSSEPRPASASRAARRQSSADVNTTKDTSEPRPASASRAARRQSSADVNTTKDTSEPRPASASRAARRQSSADVTTMKDSSEPRPASASRAARRQSSADIPAVQDDADSFCSDADGSSDDNYSRNETVVDGNDVWCSKTNQFGTLPEFDEEHACSDVLFDNKSNECDYFRSLFTADTVQNIVNQTNLYAQQTKSKYIRRAGCKVRESGQTKNWSPLTPAELDAFIGMHN